MNKKRSEGRGSAQTVIYPTAFIQSNQLRTAPALIACPGLMQTLRGSWDVVDTSIYEQDEGSARAPLACAVLLVVRRREPGMHKSRSLTPQSVRTVSHLPCFLRQERRHCPCLASPFLSFFYFSSSRRAVPLILHRKVLRPWGPRSGVAEVRARLPSPALAPARPIDALVWVNAGTKGYTSVSGTLDAARYVSSSAPLWLWPRVRALPAPALTHC